MAIFAFRYSPAQTIVSTPGHLASAGYLASSNLVSATGAKLISNAGLAGAIYPATAAHNGYVSTSGGLLAAGISGGAASGLLHTGGIVSSPGYYGAGSKLIAGNGLYTGHGIYSTNGLYTNAHGLNAHGALHANGLLATTSGLRLVYSIQLS